MLENFSGDKNSQNLRSFEKNGKPLKNWKFFKTIFRFLFRKKDFKTLYFTYSYIKSVHILELCNPWIFHVVPHV